MIDERKRKFFMEENKTLKKEKQKHTWMHARLWLALILYWLFSMIGAGVLQRLGYDETAESGWIILSMLTVVVLCMATERGEWKLAFKIVFPIIAWIMHALFQVIALFTIGALMYMLGLQHLDRFVSFMATLPIVIYAMRQSRLFVKKEQLLQI